MVTAAEDDDMNNEMITIVHTAEGDNSGYAGQTVNVVVTIVDNDSPSLMIGTTSATVAEEGTTSWTVRLNTKPDTNVTVAQTVVAGDGANPDADAVTVTEGATSLTFTPDNWDKPQTVTITGAADADLANETAAVTHTPSGATGYDADLARTVPVSVTDNDTASLVLSKTTVEVTETDSDVQVADAFNVKLSAMPASDVTITVSSNNTDVEIAANDATLTIQPSNWDTGEGVSLTIKADDEGDNESATISLSASGAEFAGKTGSVVVNVTDDDQPGITVSETSISFNNESGSETFTVVLNTMPANDVVVRVSSSDAGAVTVSSGATQDAASVDLTFTGGSGGDWASPQTVTVEPVSDADVGDESVTLTVAVQSGPYSVPSRSVAVTVTDNTTGNLVLVPTSLTVDEGGNDTYTVVLSAPGKTDVTVKISSADTAVATVSHSSLTFTPQNYATPQMVTVYGTQDEDSANDTGLQIGHTASGGGYDISTAQNVTVTVTDDDTPSLVMSATELTVNEGGTGTYTVKLNTQPTGSVTVNITGAGGNNEVTIDKSSLVFTTGNWNSTQTVMVTGVEDDNDLTNDDGYAGTPCHGRRLRQRDCDGYGHGE